MTGRGNRDEGAWIVRRGRRYRIRTEDELFATGFLDQRMLAWLLDRDEGWTFEVGGRWATVSHRDLHDLTLLDRSVDVVRLFVRRCRG